MNDPLDRRSFLALGGAALGAVLSGALTACSSQAPPRPEGLGSFGTIYTDRDTLEPVGRAAVKSTGIERNARDLELALSPRGSPATWIRTADVTAVRRYLRASVAADFAQGRVVDVGGWQLPLTEARAAALVYVTR